MALIISPDVMAKLASKDPPVSKEAIVQCFANRRRGFLADMREDHLTNPITRWFIAQTDAGRKLKVAFIPEGGNIIIRTAYNPNATEIRIYEKYSSELTDYTRGD